MPANNYPKAATYRCFLFCGIPLSIAVAVAIYFALPRLQIPTDNPVFTAILLLIAPAAVALIICTAAMTRTGYFNEPDAKLALLYLAIALPGAADDEDYD